MHHKAYRRSFSIMVLTTQLSLGPFLLSTLGIFELSVVYCPITNNFHISPLDNDQENMGTAKLNASVPILEYNILPRQVYIYKNVVDCVGSGEPTGEITPDLVYFALNDTSDRVIAVENCTEAGRFHFDDNGDYYIVGYCKEEEEVDKCTLKLFKGVIPFVTENNVTSLDFKNSYITIKDVQSTNEYAVVDLFGRTCVEIDCKESIS